MTRVAIAVPRADVREKLRVYAMDWAHVWSAAVNPALTIMANALRVGDHLLDRLAVSTAEYESNKKNRNLLAVMG